ncbi:NAD(P)-dependent oxidoreductase [Phytoactinopolyspora alkaliphila]|uniref:NAD(P)-dependent oxidoreductase n=2 Tax=Phytoactinopolyspora alkaliphila TaxID=1783498 RepID=A0A6N9YLA3_9ACTN|nr:NAD(P)-dependent oxidoreductase [Phytoactinopolyspora alkaliphila]NED95659.1 NAD(P)-dependent oxidoreductase [Phytoactinopolyspora alkaliphila]
MRKLDGDIVVLGAAGKMGPSLVRLAVRAVHEAGTGANVIAVSRFSQPGSAEALQAAGAQVVTADIADDDVLASLPEAANVVFLVGAKFGSSGNEPSIWATNTYLPGRVAQRYAGSRIVALSTGNVYPLTPTGSGGPTEAHPVGPVGEYAMSCLGRERIFTHAAHERQTPTALIRLNYAVEPRYGVLVDIAQKVRSGQPVDLTTGYANVVWQGYANQVVLRSLLHADIPPFVLNLTGPETVSIRAIAEQFGRIFGTDVTFMGQEEPTALLSNAGRCHGLFGYPDFPLAQLVELTAGWILDNQPLLGKPTKFEVRDGRF